MTPPPPRHFAIIALPGAVAETADAWDLKSLADKACGFDSHLPHFDTRLDARGSFPPDLVEEGAERAVEAPRHDAPLGDGAGLEQSRVR